MAEEDASVAHSVIRAHNGLLLVQEESWKAFTLRDDQHVHCIRVVSDVHNPDGDARDIVLADVEIPFCIFCALAHCGTEVKFQEIQNCANEAFKIPETARATFVDKLQKLLEEKSCVVIKPAKF